MYGCVFEPDPETALFGFSLSLLHHSVSMQRTVKYGMIIARKVILKLWKSDTVFKDMRQFGFISLVGLIIRYSCGPFLSKRTVNVDFNV